jgi:uncharacterized protein (TIGR03545 family)
MGKWIRWQGLTVFAAVLILLLAFWFLLVDVLVKRLIEKTGTQMVGARVELGKADLSLFPAGLTLTRLQVTDPDQPMKNAVEIARLSGKIDGLNLLRRKIIVQEMSLEGVRFGTNRTHSGVLPRAEERKPSPEKAAKRPAFEIPSFELPSVEKILQKEPLKSVKLLESFRGNIATEKENWQKRLAELPDQKKIDEYRSRVEKLRSSSQRGVGGIIGGAGEALDLQKEIEKDLDRIQKAQKEFSTKLASAQDQFSLLEKAPLEDIDQLKKKYSPTSFNAGNWARLLLEGKVQAWVGKALYWREKLNPVLERAKERKGKAEVVRPLRGKGVDVRFPEYHPLPDFLVRLLKVSAQLNVGEISGRLEDITPDQDVLGRPLRFWLSGEKLQFASLAKMEGVLDHVSPAHGSDSVKLLLQGYRAKNWNLSPSSDFPLQLADGVANLGLQAVLREKVIDSDLTATLKSTRLEMGKKDESNPLLAALASGLSNVSSFTIKAKVSGPLDNYQVEVSSDLGDQVKNAVTSQLQKYASGFDKELSSAVFQKVGGPMQEAKGSLGDFGSIGKELQDRLRQITGLQSAKTPQKLPGAFKLF